jgi:predicted Zn-dependent peptidase
MGLKAPLDRTNFNLIQKMTLNDVKAFNANYIKGQKRVVVVLGNKDEVDLKGLEKYGKVTTLSLEEIFGY